MIVLLKRQDRIDFVINRVAEYYKVTPDALYSFHRRHDLVQRKSFLIYILSDVCDVHLKEIHTALHYATSKNLHGPSSLLYKIREDLAYNKKVQSEYNKLAAYLEIL